MEKACKVCNFKFHTESNRSTYCSLECKSKATFMRKQESLKRGIEGVDYVIDKWNGYATPRIYGKWMKSMHPGKTTEDYLAEFPGAPLYCQNDHEATHKNSGKHMKDPKYRKMASEAIKGAKNPNHRSRVSKEVRQSRSPFSTKFSGYSTQEEAREFQKEHCHKGVGSNKLEYWLNQGYDKKEAEALLSERQATFTLDRCIQKLGEEQGTQRFNERQEKWSARVEEKYKNGEFTRFCKNNWSKVEECFIQELVDVLKLNDNEYYSAINGKQFFRNFKEYGKTFAYDFVYKKKIIEFNGDYWHCNPEIYEADYFNTSLQSTAQEKWNFDKWKISLIEKYGYQVLTIWESEWYQNPEETIKKCIAFLND